MIRLKLIKLIGKKKLGWTAEEEVRRNKKQSDDRAGLYANSSDGIIWTGIFKKVKPEENQNCSGY